MKIIIFFVGIMFGMFFNEEIKKSCERVDKVIVKPFLSFMKISVKRVFKVKNETVK